MIHAVSPAPELVYHRRGLCWFYFAFTFLFAVLGLLFLMIALGLAVEPVPWRHKWLPVAGWGVVGLCWLLASPQMWSMRRMYRGNQVRLGSHGLVLDTPGGHHFEFEYSNVRSVGWNPALLVRLCTVETDNERYRFDARACPRVAAVARLIAERSGRPLRIEGR